MIHTDEAALTSFPTDASDNGEILPQPLGILLRPVHPGRTLEAEMKQRGMTANALALRLRVPSNRLTDIVRGKRGISPETALRLGRFFGNGPAFWVSLQANYDLAVVQREVGPAIEREVERA